MQRFMDGQQVRYYGGLLLLPGYKLVESRSCSCKTGHKSATKNAAETLRLAATP